MLTLIFILGTRVFMSTSYTRGAQAHHGKISFQASKQVSRRNYVVNGPDSSIEADHGWRKLTVSGVAPGLARWIAPILHARQVIIRPSKGCVARDLVASAFQHSGVQRVMVSHHYTSQNPEPQNTESTQSRAHGHGTRSQEA
jgi:hypothetical protein